jgi:DNA-binding transcriptional LysR family regulator
LEQIEMVIQTHPQASIATTVIDNSGATRPAVVTSKQFLMNRLRDFHWHSVSEFTTKISRSGIRGRLAELRAAGYDFATRYGPNGRLTAVRLTTLPGVGSFTATPFPSGNNS